MHAGMEQLFGGKGFSGMSEEDKQRFLDAVTGEDGKVNSLAAAALIAAAASGGDPEMAEKIVERMMSGLGGEDAEIDPAMMAALMATTAMAAQGASNEEVRALFISVTALGKISPNWRFLKAWRNFEPLYYMAIPFFLIAKDLEQM